MEEKLYPEFRQTADGAGAALERLNRIIRLLRSENGCPWDRVQTHESLEVCMVEEAYEVNEAIESKNWDNLEEELGDVLLQVIFHGQLGEDANRFDLTSVANRECEKMIRRHPHVFENESENGQKYAFSARNTEGSIDNALEKWENVKRRETKGSQTDSMRQIPKALPALRKSHKIQAKAADVGFDWDRVEEAFQKVDEERRELWEAYISGDAGRVHDELGDLLFAAVNIARFLGVDSEDALNSTSQRFINRFGFIEETVLSEGHALTDFPLSELDKLWEVAKQKEKAKLL